MLTGFTNANCQQTKKEAKFWENIFVDNSFDITLARQPQVHLANLQGTGAWTIRSMHPWYQFHPFITSKQTSQQIN